MNLLHLEQLLGPEADDVLLAEDVAEVVLLLPARQAAALEREARRRGMTTGEMMRRLVRDFLTPGGDHAEGPD